MAKASQFTTTGTIDPALDMIPYMKWDGIKFVNRKVTAVNAGIQQPDYVAQAQATSARAQANEASDIADTALATAWTGTSIGQEASRTATVALSTAWVGTSTAHEAYNVARTALTTSWTGTATAHEAYDIGRVALETAWIGTNIVEPLAQQAMAVATTALSTAWVGTSTAHEAYNVARTALTTSWTGTRMDTLSDVTITSPLAAQSLVYDGSKWINSDPTSVTSPTFYTGFYDDTPSVISGFHTFTQIPSGLPEAVTTVSVGDTNRGQFIDAYLSGTLARTYLSPGLWEFSHYASVDNATRPVFMAWDVFVRTAAGAEQFWFSGTSSEISTTTVTHDNVQQAQDARAVNSDDRLLVKLWAYRSSPNPVNFSFYANGGTHNSHIHTPFGVAHNDLFGLQGGQAGEYYHLTSDQKAAALGSVGSPSSSNKFITQTDPTLQAYGLATYAIGLTGTASSSGGGGADLATAWAGTAAAREARAVAQTGLETAWAGTVLATSAHSVASSAYNVAVSGTVGSVTVGVSSGTAVLDMEGQVYQTVYITGDTAITVTNQKPITPTKVQEITAVLRSDGNAHNVSCDNFNWMTDAVATIGANKEIFLGLTSFGSLVSQVYASALIEDTRFLSMNANSIQAYNMARTALDTSWVGTTAAAAAQSQANASYRLAQSAYTLAQAGTVSHSTLSASAGTVVFSMSGSAYQSAVIGGDTAITVTNIQAPSMTHIQAITARIHNNNSGSNFNLFWDGFGILGAAPPATVSNNHSVFASFTSYGSDVQNVFLATASHV